MFTLPNFCRVCLKYDKNLIDLAHIENEPSETLMSKLQLCVSEVEWTTFKPLLCHPCIKRLNIAYSFKKQCVQSAGVLKNYIELVKESQKKNESQAAVKTESALPQTGAYMLLPNHKYVKILVGNQNQNSTGNANNFQNVFLNLIPATTISPIPNTAADKNKDTNQNVFLNLNNTIQKFIPVTTLQPPPLKKTEPVKKQQNSGIVNVGNANVSQLLTESNAEEMSVEIDPTSFLSLEHDDPSSEDEIKTNVIYKPNNQKKSKNEVNANGVSSNGTDPSSSAASFAPVIPKETEIYSGGHFLNNPVLSDYHCESCQKSFATARLLKQHIKQFHLGKLPFNCHHCFSDYLTRAEYDACLSRHKKELDSQKTSLTLSDLKSNSSYECDLLNASASEIPADLNLEPNEHGQYVCDVCVRVFTAASGLLRHRVRKHNQKNRKKYFIKGMKNAQCDICKREFSTHSYMLLHRKLHMREDGGYKFKVQGKSKYKDVLDEEGNVKEKEETKKDGEEEEEINVTPDLTMKDEYESDSDSDNEGETQAKKAKLDVESSNQKLQTEKEDEEELSSDPHDKREEGPNTENVNDTDSSGESSSSDSHSDQQGQSDEK
ncbi:zinc finger and BTB domain-containing protein 17-like [Anthonomus grandis grandis]|uniref:zinc finger and BTB domain-containing protein 17-like n=1 Tax=Anthonomus grandis grandis TaxID=2921223 RepID=UPI002166433F|nr:zinc finger and BTB domain-containing protein 17-like [Anthonomus grandis grandis]